MSAAAAPKETFTYEDHVTIADFIKNTVANRPTVAIICGSGLSNLADEIDSQVVLPFADIPGWPISKVQGHVSRLVFGTMGGKSVVAIQGRSHFYEGKTMSQIAMPVRVMSLIGVTHMIITNAAGGMNASFSVGDLMILNDHINFVGLSGSNPFIGPNIPEFGQRFFPTNNIYSKDNINLIKKAAALTGATEYIREGCYVHVAGPFYESPAEIRFLSALGADAVGMSTVPEVLAAHHCGMTVMAMSMITNACVTRLHSTEAANHEEVLQITALRAKTAQSLVHKIVELL